ncbi:hypothetical protein J3456_02735 [Sulfitobacter sp. NFXS29]|uniref:hypothetical protein n=1 Tax=Sulfitobacter sp. NFXS29 TaxID=2818438 RepID=UPI0032DF17A1
MIVTLPATALHRVAVVPAQITDLYGSLWKGRAVLSGGYSLDWEVRGRSLLLARGVVDWTLQGNDTQLTGVASATPWALEARTVVGRAGPGLLALVPEFALKNCTSRAVVDVQTLRWQEGRAAAAGVVSVEAGSCEDLLGSAATIPQMTLDLTTQGSDARGQLRDRDSVLAEFTVTGDRRLIARVEPEGAVLVPGMPTGGPIIIEYPF